MKKILAIFLSLIIIPVALAGCNGCGDNKQYAGTYVSSSGFESYVLTLTSSGKFTYKKNNSIKDEPDAYASGTYTIDDSGEETKITLTWKYTNPITSSSSDVQSTGTISKSGKTIKIAIYGEKTFTKN